MKSTVVIAVAAIAAVGVGVVFYLNSGCRQNLDATITEGELYQGDKKLQAVEDWPQWLGPRGDGISRETGISTAWPKEGPPKMWKANVGIGYSSPIAAGGRVYLFSLGDKRETLTCFDANTGKIIWNDGADAGWIKDYPGTRATPAIAGDVIYTYGAAGHLIARDLKSGKPKWTVKVIDHTGGEPLQWGTASSPLVELGHIFVQGGKDGAAAAAVTPDGKVAWTSEYRGAGYASPILADVQGTKQLIIFAGDAIVGMDPLTGRTIWSHPWPTSYNVNASTPVYHEGRLFITSAYDRGCALFQLSPTGATKVWENKEIKSQFQPVILDNGHLYANSERRLKCVSWADGKRKWYKDGAEWELGDRGPLLRVGDMLLLMGETGTITLARATPEKFEPLASFEAQVSDGPQVWSTPLLYGQRLYVKGPKELICYDLSGK